MERIAKNNDERQWGMFTHLAALAAFVIPFGSIIGPLIIYMIKKDEFEFVNDQGKEVINFQITWALIFLVSGLLILVAIGIFLLIGFGVAWIVLVIIGISKANQGIYHRFPMTIRFIK